MNEPSTNASDRGDFISSVESIQEAQTKGGVFAEAVRVTRMPMIIAEPSVPGDPIIFANSAFLEMSGYSGEEVLGRGPYFLAEKGGDEQAVRRLNAALAEGNRELLDLVCRGKDGRTFTAVVSASPITDDQGRLKHFFSFLDTSEHIALQKSVAASEQIFRLLVQGVTDYAIYMLDPEGRIASWNSGAERIKGYLAEEVLGKHVSLFYTEEDRRIGGAQEAIATAEREGRFETESWRVRKDGTKFLAHVIIDAIRDQDGHLVGFAKVTRDITERQRIRDAEHASEAKTQFLASMSHEIRTPLNGIIGYTERLIDENLTLTQRRYAERIQTSGAALLTVINDILDLSQIEAGRTELEEHPFSLEALVDNVISIMSGAAEAKGLSIRLVLDPGLPQLLVGDEGRLRQVLLNLLNNAVKFTQEGQVWLAVHSERRTSDGENLLFRVTDTGIGIPQDKRHRLFRRFSQIDQTIRREYGGTGLGLAISKRLIDLMGGEIDVESKEGEGSTFWFRVTLPLAAPQETPSAQEETGVVPTKSARILLVDDLEINQDLARSILEAAGHHVHVACDGAEAVDAARAEDYELILMDIQMPVMDGVAATKEIRASGHGGPIIAMTANVMPQQIRSFHEAGMNDHIGKPMKRNDLIGKVAEWLSKASEKGTAAPERSGRPRFDREAFDEVRELMGPERTAAWLKRLEEQLHVVFRDKQLQSPDRQELGRSAHAIVSEAGNLGFSELSGVCAQLEDACVSGSDLTIPIEEARQAAHAVLEIIQGLRRSLP